MASSVSCGALPSSEDELSISEFRALVARLDALDKEKLSWLGRGIVARHLALMPPLHCSEWQGGKMFRALSSRVAEYEGGPVAGGRAAGAVLGGGNGGDG